MVGRMTRTSGTMEGGGVKRSRRSRLLEVLMWVGVAILTAVILVYATERFLPANF